jgi:uncharacterized protein
MSLEVRTLEAAALEIREEADGHHLIGIVAPWRATYEFAPGVTEEFAPGVFDKSVAERGEGRIPLLEQHAQDRHPVGQSVSFTKTPEGLVADFRLARTARGEEARQLALDGMVGGLSVGFRPLRNKTEERDGRRHIIRLEAKLDHVGLVTQPAYAEARILSVRGAFDPDDPEIAPRLARWRHLLL